MIEYSRGPYGANLLLRWHGSALAKAFIPGLISVGIYLALHFVVGYDQNDYLNHPYAIGVLVSSVSFLIVFRANYGYQRYWEACTMVHKLQSKFMDATMFASVFHLQSEHYACMRPPSFFDYDRLNRMRLTRDREQESAAPCVAAPSEDALDADVEDCRRAAMENVPPSGSVLRKRLNLRQYGKSINETRSTRNFDILSESCDESHLLGPPRLDGGWGLLYPNEINGKPTATYYDHSKEGNGEDSKHDRPPPDKKGFASTLGGRTPSLFLQELAHLSSLLCAVALTTLRNDLDDVESPLEAYIPGQPWPEADPVQLSKEVKAQAYHGGRIRRNGRYLLGMDQTKRARTIYNAARPMLVLGGVSDNEIAFLQRARGPYAKTQLVWSWLSDFIVREHMAGSMGKVGPPIVSRIIQFLSDGILYYNHARKIMFTPFPFPHAQLSAFFVLMAMIAIPFLMNQYANEVWLGAALSFLTVTCLAGLHEVARELENPFRNAPNDVPLCTLLAFYNEALVTMFAGFHPDAYWDQAEILKKERTVSSIDEAIDEVPIFVPELPFGEEKDGTGLATPSRAKRPKSAIPQSADDGQPLKELREMINSQALKLKELQERIEKQNRPKTAP